MSSPRVPLTDPAADKSTWRTYQLLRFSPLTAFTGRAELDEVVTWVKDDGYRVLDADGAGGDAHDVIAQFCAMAPEWPPGWASTLDGFNDALTELDGDSFVFVIRSFDALSAADSRGARALLEMLARNAWWHVVQGRLLLTFVETSAGRPTPSLVADAWNHWWPTPEQATWS